MQAVAEGCAGGGGGGYGSIRLREHPQECDCIFRGRARGGVGGDEEEEGLSGEGALREGQDGDGEDAPMGVLDCWEGLRRSAQGCVLHQHLAAYLKVAHDVSSSCVETWFTRRHLCALQPPGGACVLTAAQPVVLPVAPRARNGTQKCISM